MDNKEYPPRLKFEVSDKTNSREYFMSRQYLTYTLVGAKVGDELRNVSDEISVPSYPGNIM